MYNKANCSADKIEFYFPSLKNTLMESCSGENLTHDVRYQATIQRPQPNYVKYPVYYIQQITVEQRKLVKLIYTGNYKKLSCS